MNDLYLAGEPHTNSEASLVISFDWNYPTSEEHPDYDEELHVKYNTLYSESEAILHLTFKQVNIKSGTLESITKVVPITGRESSTIELSRNELVNSDDYLGIFFSDFEP